MRSEIRTTDITGIPDLTFFIIVHPPPELLPVLGPLERYVTPTLDTALLCSSRVVLIYHVLKQTIWLQLRLPSPSPIKHLSK